MEAISHLFDRAYSPIGKNGTTDEESFLKNRVPKIERISHIGSTAINSIYAKPIIDILVEISKDYCLSDYKEVIVKKRLYLYV